MEDSCLHLERLLISIQRDDGHFEMYSNFDYQQLNKNSVVSGLEILHCYHCRMVLKFSISIVQMLDNAI